MMHVAVDQFWRCYEAMPLEIRRTADNSFSIIKQYPNHPLLRLTRSDGIVSMRIGGRCRALGVENGQTTIWFWMGSYKQYAAVFQ